MGYITQYILDIQCFSEEENNKILNEDLCDFKVKELFEDGVECKWYEHNVEMICLSRKYPDVLFTLNGEGEESGDIWRKYYKNGKVQVAHAKITFDEFDPKKLE